MNTFVIYCKSYWKDVDRAKKLLDSIEKYNQDKLPFYISVPRKDLELFKSRLGVEGYTLIADEDIYECEDGWAGQQLVKSQFWKLGLCDNYLSIDSDCYFIKPFYQSDFMYDNDTPYTICHEYKSFFENLDKLRSDTFNPTDRESFVSDRQKIMEVFGRKGIVYDFGPGPTIWSAKVWRSLEEHYITPNKLTFRNLIEYCPSEFTWYGEWILASEVIKLMPRGPIFKNYHYPQQYHDDRQRGYGVSQIANLYLGIGIQSIFEF